MKHVDDQLLAALALDDVDDLPADEVAAAREHLDGCAQCAGELAGLQETFQLVRTSGDEDLVAPPPSVWAAISAEIARDAGPTAGPTAEPDPEPAAEPTAERAAEPAAGPVVELSERRRRGIPTWLASTAAAVALLLGLGGGYLLAGQPDEPAAPQAQVVGTAELASLDETPEERGTAEVRRQDGRVVLHVEADSLGGPDGVREVWLINVDGTRMVSLGLLPGDEAGEFEVPDGLLRKGYRIVDISYEPVDGDPTHSGQSLARGTIDG